MGQKEKSKYEPINDKVMPRTKSPIQGREKKFSKKWKENNDNGNPTTVKMRARIGMTFTTL